ncbi:MAG: SDR family NAD(P)-dependent oxidoreductase [Gammaproteobacteria bacterium]|jgi:NAD(P)-dependent dehydrogenase (short-subunit alcohol dehydrogenase family)|nr:SDR family NAD(P)-dependent oxidoreductase [Gammaproteobacteria bacterium]
MDKHTVLITGCSSGIGAALALEMHRRGWQVFATARRPAALQPLADKGLHTLPLDVNDDDSISQALRAVAAQAGQLDMLVNNAGFSQVGAVVDLTREDLRRQYETNVIAPVAVTRAALPLLRKAVAARGNATIANVGSIVGTFTTPFAGAYCSSKAALHALSDALRMELAPLGIHMVTIQPGGIRSAFGDHAEEGLTLPADSLYHPVEKGIRARAQAGQQGATPAEEFVQKVADGLLQERPPAIIRGGKNSLRLPLMKKLLPMAVFDNILAKNFGLDRWKP